MKRLFLTNQQIQFAIGTRWNTQPQATTTAHRCCRCCCVQPIHYGYCHAISSIWLMSSKIEIKNLSRNSLGHTPKLLLRRSLLAHRWTNMTACTPIKLINFFTLLFCCFFFCYLILFFLSFFSPANEITRAGKITWILRSTCEFTSWNPLTLQCVFVCHLNWQY